MVIEEYYITHKLSAPQINQAAQYIINWSEASGDVSIPIGEEMASLMATKTSMPYFIAYLASYSYYCLTENTKQLDKKYFAYAIDILLQFYEPNSELTGKVELLENYLKLKKKGKLEKELSKVYSKQTTNENK